jgi:drug/metabolite transporter (DMT)-like permease
LVGIQRGPLYMIIASAAFTAMVACVRVARQELSGFELVFWRGAISLPLLAALIGGRGFRLRNRKPFALRTLFGFCAMACFYTAAKETDLVTLSLITRLQPILIAIAAPLVLGKQEHPGGSVWVAALVGFGGSALLLAPDLQSGSFASLWAFAATCFSAAAHLALRRVATENRGPAVVFWFHAGMVVLALGALAGTDATLTAPRRELWWLLLGVGVFATAGQLLLTRAYAVERAPVVAAAAYTGVLWALLVDLMVFRHVPSWAEIGGGVLVLVASLWLVLRKKSGGRGWRHTPSDTVLARSFRP